MFLFTYIDEEYKNLTGEDIMKNKPELIMGSMISKTRIGKSY